MLDEPFAERLISNCGALLLSTLSRVGVQALELRSVAIVDAKIVGTAGQAALTDISFAHLDVRGADCRAITFNDCSVTTLTVDALSAFGLSRPKDVQALQIEDLGAIQTLRAPDEVERWLVDHSTRPATVAAKDGELPLVRYFDRLCRKFARQHQIRTNPDDEGFFLIQDALWPEVQALLGSRIVTDTRAARGPRSVFYRMIRPEALLAPPRGDEESAQLRKSVLERARQLGKGAIQDRRD